MTCPSSAFRLVPDTAPPGTRLSSTVLVPQAFIEHLLSWVHPVLGNKEDEQCTLHPRGQASPALATFPSPAWPLPTPAALLSLYTQLLAGMEEQRGARAEPGRGR